MTLIVLALIALAHPAHAADLTNFNQTAKEFAAARAPSEKELESALWMATSIASNPQIRGALSGRFPTGRIPSDAGFVRQIARIDIASSGRATARINTTDAADGTHIDEIRHEGRLDSSALTLKARGDSQTCATKSACRVFNDKTLVCAQMNDDSRKVCTQSYKKGAISSFLGYSPAHP